MKVPGYSLVLLLSVQTVYGDELSDEPLLFCNSHWPPYSYGEPFNTAVVQSNLMVDEAPSILGNFMRLDRHWIDVFLVNRMAAEYSLHDYPLLRARVIAQEGPFEAVGFRVGLSKSGRAAGLLARFDRAIEDMREDGSIDRIMRDKPFEYR